MKRNIECPTCANSWRGMIGKYPGESIKVFEGTVKKDCLCDGCGIPLPMGTPGAAVSVYTESTPYSRWEHNYIDCPPCPTCGVTEGRCINGDGRAISMTQIHEDRFKVVDEAERLERGKL